MASKIPPHLHDATRRKIRGVIMTGSVAAITIVGTMTGAALRTDSDRKKEVQRRREMTPGEQIAHLESIRGEWMAKRIGLEMKIEEIHKREAGMSYEESRVGRERKRGGGDI